MTVFHKLVLASASPRRMELLFDRPEPAFFFAMTEVTSIECSIYPQMAVDASLNQ